MGNESKYLLQKRIRDLEQKIGEYLERIGKLESEVKQLEDKIKELEPKVKVEYIIKADETLQSLIDEIKAILDTMSPDLQKKFIFQLRNTIKMMAEVAKGNFNPFNMFKSFMA